ncbi:hypothetical protein [Qipengyuania nanhaisediminis]|uniref:Uncharacterized protein n=1 Tax=Qipengyuania nanhaisediminis TaxID=604088 RepID=A0A1I5KAZ4_9SPHN|nr:hypothetical protein [Qipengyuania nanhaisediminis]SFO81766.1 hypothetical protein SAMN04488060_0025 [Qipengyuania nanhaisediminis]
MLILTSAAAITHAVAYCAELVPEAILQRYAELLETEATAWIFVLQPGDSSGCLETFRRRPFEVWEFIARQDGWYEAVFIICDDGFGHVVLIPDQRDTAPDLLTICKANAD